MMERTFTSANFESEVLSSTVPVLVDFYADWCGPCKMMAPAVEQLAQELEGKAVVGKLNVDDNEDIAVKYQVMSIPTLIVFKYCQAVKNSVGLQSKDDVRKMVESV